MRFKLQNFQAADSAQDIQVFINYADFFVSAGRVDDLSLCDGNRIFFAGLRRNETSNYARPREKTSYLIMNLLCRRGKVNNAIAFFEFRGFGCL